MRMFTRPAWLVAPFATVVMSLTAACSAGGPEPDYRAGSLSNEEPQAIYSADPSDSWNRTFNTLFTRTVRFRLTEEFAAGAPLERVRINGFPDLPVTTARFERIESGDLAIEPLDPFPVHAGNNGSPQRVFTEPRFTPLKQALADALREGPSRPPLARALMQSDLWAAHDVLAASQPRDQVHRGHREELLGLLARSVKKLSLSPREVEALPDNYASAHLPFDLFAADGGWIEVEYLPDRLHDFSADYRRVARVFLKPSSTPTDRDAWLDGLRKRDVHTIEKLDAVALVVQLLLVDADGVVVPSRLTYEVQVRSFPKGGAGGLSRAKLSVAELSRKTLLLDRQAGGLRPVEERAPSYLPAAGNDYFFASSQLGRSDRNAPILAPLRKRCQACHGESLGVIMTFSVQDPQLYPHVRQLKMADNERARYVSRRKMQRADFAELKRRWEP